MRKVLILRIIVTLAVVLLSSQLLLARELTDSEKKVISDIVRKNLLDPDSARFKWLPLAGSRPDTYCGLVNSKNTFGGYAGDAPFEVFISWIHNSVKVASVLWIGTADWSSDNSKLVLNKCAKDGYPDLYKAK